MLSLALLRDLVIVFGVAMVVALAFTRLRLPPVVGYILTGVLVGPNGIALVQDQHEVEVLAEIGIVALLFSIGVELSLGEMWRGRRLFLTAGGLQVLLTGTAGAAVALAFGLDRGAAVLVGFIVALSSTAIVLRLIAQRAEAASLHGRIALAVLVFQDLMVVPMMFALPILAGGAWSTATIVATLTKALAMIGGVMLAARVVMPRLLEVVVRSRSREVFLLTLIVLCLGVAWVSSLAGLSLALGAFLAGLIVSESSYSAQAIGAIVPFRDAFSCLFFVSIGMLLDLGQVAAQPLAVLGITTAILVGKAALIGGLLLLAGYGVRVSVLVGVMLAQAGEFSFLLLAEGTRLGILDGAPFTLLMAATVLTMLFTPLVVPVAPRLAAAIARLRPERYGDQAERSAPERTDHVIVIGYGVNGQNTVRALQHVGMGFVVIELNPETVRRLRSEGQPIVYGDAVYPEVLLHAGIERARVVVVTIPDAAAVRQIVQMAHELNPAAHLVVRTRFVAEVPSLYAIGANEVIPEEFETSIEVVSRVLRAYMVPRERIDEVARLTRSEGYEMLRSASEGFRPVEGLRRLLGDVEFEAYGVFADSAVVDKTLAEADIRRQTGALVLAVHRLSRTHPNPPADWKLLAEDVVLVIGPPEALARAAAMFGPQSST